MARWIPFLESPGDPFDAANREDAIRVARRIYGARVSRVQSEVSWVISQEDEDANRRDRIPPKEVE